MQEIDFTDETKEIEVDNDVIQFFNNVIRRLKAFDMENIKQNHESEINKFFGIIEEKYDGKNFFSDTRELIKNQVQDLLENGFYNLLN